MKKLVITTVLIMLAFSATIFAQQDTKVNPVFKPTFLLGDVYIVMNILESVDIKGNEVEAFLDVKNTMNGYLEDAKNKNLKVTDKVTVNMPGHIAQNVISFLSRATLKGNMADSYKRFIDAIIESSKTAK